MVKVCGITNREDALAAVEAGATALGFNFYPGSPRFITPEAAAEIDGGVTRVGVFVDEPRARVAEIARTARLDVVQLHGQETPADYPERIAVWKAVRVRDGFDWSEWERCPADALLLDGPASGEIFDWRLASRTARRVILAGGLSAANVRDAIALARPWGVDACSRIECAPGRKDHVKMREFIQAARSAFAC
jgi:phosphoribosylanthranilate isomerase